MSRTNFYLLKNEKSIYVEHAYLIFCCKPQETCLKNFLQNFVLRTMSLAHSDNFHYKIFYSFCNL